MFNGSYFSQFGDRTTFNNIQGNQNNHTHYCMNQNQVMPASELGQEWKIRMYREMCTWIVRMTFFIPLTAVEKFERVPIGKIRIIRAVAVNHVGREEYKDDNIGPPSSKKRYSTSRVKRVAHLACIVEGDNESSPFLCMEYTGCDSHKLFKRDFLTFSRTRHANVMQLRGFNDSDTPMVLFHEGTTVHTQIEYDGAEVLFL
ncbi:hypothetical protein L218DRAFT_375891 [Marasmius fiardii PR-910]|nr:hypothetical protein L218DRAFT_375891 [Marasmius fiardii PR-910]